MTIEEALSAIKNAVYGKDVRQAMHDGILQAEGGAGTVAKEAEKSSKKAAASAKESEIASKAIEGKADQAVTIAKSANSKSDSTQLQLDEIVINGDSSVEAAQARIDINNIQHPTLKDRLDKEQQKAKELGVSTFYEKNIGSIPINFNRFSSEPLVTASDVGGLTELAFPVVMNMTKYLTNPIDNYYMYTSPHNGPGGVYLLTAPNPYGPWTYYGKLIDNSVVNATNHISSMDVIYVPELNKFYGYLHSAFTPGVDGQSTFLLTSDDGLDWDLYSMTPVMPAGKTWYTKRSHTYIHVIRYGGMWYAFGQAEDEPSVEKQCVYYSENGIDWYPDLNNPIDGLDYGFPTSVIYSSCLLVVGQTIYAFVTVPDLASNDKRRDIYLLRSDDGSNFKLVKNEPVLSPNASGTWDTAKVEYPYAFIEGDTIYLYYMGSSGEYYPSKIGLTTTKIGGAL